MLHKNILLVRDESPFGVISNELQLKFEQLEVSVAEIITERVYLEVEKYNRNASNYQHALVKPKSVEVRLNHDKEKQKPRVNAEKQVTVALDAFKRNIFFILVDDTQVETLEQIVTITPETIVSFVKLTPLIGG